MEFLTDRDNRRQTSNPKPEELEQSEKEIKAMMDDFKAAEESHGERVLHFSFIRAYVKKLLDHLKIVRFLTMKHCKILTQFTDIAATDSLTTVSGGRPEEGGLPGASNPSDRSLVQSG